MSDDKPRPTDETQPVRPDGGALLPPAPAAGAAGAPAEPAPAARRGFRERMRSLRSSDGNRSFGLAALIASALAGIIVGGLGATALHAVGDDRGRGGWMDRVEQRGPIGRGGDDGRGGMRGSLPGAPGQLQPEVAPEDEGSSSIS